MVFVDNAGIKACEAFFQEQAIDHTQANGSEEQAVAQLIVQHFHAGMYGFVLFSLFLS